MPVKFCLLTAWLECKHMRELFGVMLSGGVVHSPVQEEYEYAVFLYFPGECWWFSLANIISTV